MKIGIIGIGSIAEKAYLPVYAGLSGAELHFCTRNEQTLRKISDEYRWTHLYQSVDRLIESGIDAAFVHAATSAHPAIISKLLNEGISVYTDKPIADHYETVKKLTELAEKQRVLLMTGFNRRFAPLNRAVFEAPGKSMIIYQKNRVNDPADIRKFVYDDYIHVVDTARYLLNEPVEAINVFAKKNAEDLYTNLNVVLHAGSKLAVTFMSRVSGGNEEILQAMSPESEYRVRNLAEFEQIKGNVRIQKPFGDWRTTLYKRGFVQIVEAFLDSVKHHKEEPISKADALETHRICEKIVQAAANQSNAGSFA